jgi:hypothetical protein
MITTGITLTHAEMNDHQLQAKRRMIIAVGTIAIVTVSGSAKESQAAENELSLDSESLLVSSTSELFKCVAWNGFALQSSLGALWAEGGIARLYQGLPFALVQGPIWENVAEKPGFLYRGALTQAAATAVGHFPWSLTYIFLDAQLLTQDDLLLSLARSAVLGLFLPRVFPTVRPTVSDSSKPQNKQRHYPTRTERN